MKLAVIGSRDFENYDEFKSAYSGLITERPSMIISGGAAGADSLGARWAEEDRVPLLIYFADWDRKGKGAGFLRNHDIINDCDTVLACHDLESRGTFHSMNLALTRGKKLIMYYFGLPISEGAKEITNTADSNCWLRDDFPCKVSYKGVDYNSVAKAMCSVMLAACQGHMDDYKNESEIAAMPKTHRDRLIKLMYEFQCQKFGNANAALRRKMELQKGEIALKGSDFWSPWVSKMLNKIKNEDLK